MADEREGGRGREKVEAGRGKRGEWEGDGQACQGS